VIVCVCPSPAVDVTYRVAALTPGATNRVLQVSRHPGGKAVNVARVLHTMGAEAVLVAPLGGSTGDRLRAGLADLGIRCEAVPSAIPTRHTITVVDDSGAATVLSEPAQVDCWPEVGHRCAELLEATDAVVVSGSLPGGVPDGGLAALVRLAKERGRPVVVDTSGAALAEALAAGPTLVKPNADELRELTGDRDPLVAATHLARTHGVCVVASLGTEGVLAVDRSGSWRARPARPLDGNPTGAGDALVAGLALGLANGTAMADTLADAVALSAAAVLQPHAGDVHPDDVAEQRAGVVVTELSRDAVR
jgi:tagatose 6-phosphate kinase